MRRRRLRREEETDDRQYIDTRGRSHSHAEGCGDPAHRPRPRDRRRQPAPRGTDARDKPLVARPAREEVRAVAVRGALMVMARHARPRARSMAVPDAPEDMPARVG